MIATPERRRIAVLTGDRRLDLAVPLDDTLADVLRGIGFPMESGRFAVIERNGAEAKLSSVAAEIADGALFAVIDLSRRALAVERGSEYAASGRQSHGALWWLLGMIAVVAVGLSGSGTTAIPDAARLGGAVVLGLAALFAAVIWAARSRQDRLGDSLAMLAPLALAFAAGFVSVPVTIVAGVQLAVVAGLLSSAVLAALLTATVGGLRLRSAAGTTTIILLALAAVWGVCLVLGWSAEVAAALSAGAVPLGLRALPSTLVNVPEGYHIDYRHFMSARWTVRGSVPESPGAVTMDAVRDIVEDSSARLVAGTVLLSLLPVIMLPIALLAPWGSDPIVIGGRIALLATLVLALLLLPRRSATTVLRWVPRAAAGLVALEALVTTSVLFGPLPLLGASAGLLVFGLVAALVVVPIARGAGSLVWSRFADAAEWISIALSLPAAFLAADMLTLLRGMMAA